jgi:cytochrome c553
MPGTISGGEKKMRIAIATVAAASLFTGAGYAGDNGGNIEAGKRKASVCEGCHLKGGKGFGLNPALAGQTLEYLVYALNAYKSGAREHPSMNAIAKGLSDEDIADLAAYYHSLK